MVRLAEALFVFIPHEGVGKIRKQINLKPSLVTCQKIV